MTILPSFTYKYDDKFLKYMHEQIWEAKEDLNVYHNLAEIEFSNFYEHIGNPKSVLEVGCGLGRGTIYLNEILKNQNVSYTLADRTGYTENTGAYAPTHDEYYNDLNLTKEFCELNGVSNIETFDTELDDWSNLKKFDLIFSLCSFGMHVKIERYLDRLLSVSNPTTTMIFGVRHKTYTEESFSDKFEKISYIKDDREENVTREHWLILKRPKQWSNYANTYSSTT